MRRADQEGRLTVSTTASLATKWLVSRVAAFQDAYPGIEVRITTSTHLVDFQREEVDIAVRYGHGTWPGLRAHWLMAEHIFPVCSPSLLQDAPSQPGRPLRAPEDLAHHTLLHTTVSREDWQLWLTAAGLPPGIATRRGMTFDQGFMAIQAAVEGLGVALGRFHLVEADIAAGRLVAPFDMVLPQDAGYTTRNARRDRRSAEDRPVPGVADLVGDPRSTGRPGHAGRGLTRDLRQPLPEPAATPVP